MPRHKGDHDARRRDVSAAVGRVLAAQGFGGLTMRAVAAEMGATTGLLTHYFPNKKALVAHALALLDDQRAARPTPAAPDGLPALRAALVHTLPLTPKDAAANRTWVGSWDAALADADLAAGHAARYAGARERIRAHVVTAQELGQVRAGDPDDLAAGIQAFTLGLIVQALFSPEEFPADRQLQLVDDHLATLGPESSRESNVQNNESNVQHIHPAVRGNRT